MKKIMKWAGRSAWVLPLGLVISGCSSESSTSAVDENHGEKAPSTGGAKATAYSGAMLIAGGTYQLNPRICGIYKESEAYDIEVEGPGTAPDGEKLYFSLSSTGNAVRLDLGVDGRFESSDRILIGGQHVTEPFALDVVGGNLTIAKLVMVDGNGQKVDDHASLKIDCSN